MKTELTKKQEIIEYYFNEAELFAKVYTYDTSLKRGLLDFSTAHPELCRQTDDDDQRELRFEINKRRITCRIYHKRFRVAMAFVLLCKLTLAGGLKCDFCSSGQSFAH